MKANLSYPPISGDYEEIHFEHPDIWNSQNFTWVKFEDSDFQIWYGSFRGLPLGNLAISTKKSQALIPTEDATYLIDFNTRKLIEVFDAKYQIRQVITSPNDTSFVLASNYSLYRIKSSNELIEVLCPFDVDFIHLKEIQGQTIIFEYTDSRDYNTYSAYLNCTDWLVKKK